MGACVRVRVCARVRVRARVCWLTYAAALSFVAFVFAADPFAFADGAHDAPWCNGLAAIVGATLVVYASSFACSNTSLYDPAWCLLPIALAVGWTATGGAALPGGGGASPRAWYGLA